MANDAYKRGRSGYSVKDEKAAKEYGQRDYETNTVQRRSAAENAKRNPGMSKKDVNQMTQISQREAVYRRDEGAPAAYLRNVKTAEGREINRKNIATQDRDRAAQGRPPMSKKWIEK